LGVGIGNFNEQIQHYPPVYFPIDAHNTIVLCLAELGVLGTAAFTAILCVVCLQIHRLKRIVLSTPRLQALSVDIFALETSIIMFMVGGMTVSRFYCEMLWCLLALPICLERAVAFELRHPTQEHKRRKARSGLGRRRVAKEASKATSVRALASAKRALDLVGLSGDQTSVPDGHDQNVTSAGTADRVGDPTGPKAAAAPTGVARAPRSGAGDTRGDVTEIAAGRNHAVALRSDQTVWCWGTNLEGQLGDGTYESRSAPVQAVGLSDVVAIAAGGFHTLALRSDGTVWAWGDNLFGQLGDGTQEDRATPVQVEGLSEVAAIDAGTYCSFAVQSDGTGWVWGSCCLPGDQAPEERWTPVRIPGLVDFDWLSGEDTCAFALRSDGSVWGWGSNGAGQLEDGAFGGDGTPMTPMQITGLSEVVHLVHENDYTAAIRSDGSVWTWGPNHRGPSEGGTTDSSSTPAEMPGISDVIDVAAGSWHTVALQSDGSVWAWGTNDDGQLGDGTTHYRRAPVRVPGLSDISAVSAGETHTVALQSNGRVWVWGTNAGLDDEAEERACNPVLVLWPEQVTCA